MKDTSKRLEKNRREEVEKERQLQANRDKELIAKEKRKGSGKTGKSKPPKEVKAKRGSKKQGTAPGRVSEAEREVKPVEEWIILNPVEDEHDKGTVRFAVNMYGSDFGDEEEPQYPTQQDLHADGAGDMIDSYIQDECNFSPWTELLGMKKQEAGKKDRTDASGGTESEESSRDPWSWEEAQTGHDPCDHKTYEEAITYIPERNPGYCNEGCYLFGINCAECFKRFVPDRREEKKFGSEKSFRPTTDCPIYCCVNKKGMDQSNEMPESAKCSHALCATCFRKGITRASLMGAPRSKRKRGGV